MKLPDVEPTVSHRTHFILLICCRDLFNCKPGITRLLILQCDSGDLHSDLIACARYNIANEYSQLLAVVDNSSIDGSTTKVHVLFIVQLPRIAGGCFVGFQVKLFDCF